MLPKQDTRFYPPMHIVILLLTFLIGVAILPAQTKQILTWQEDLNYLQGAPADEMMANRDAVFQIRRGIELWIKLHPSTDIELESAPPKPWDYEELQTQVIALQVAVQKILAEDTGRPFELGSTTVSVTAEASPLSPVADTFNSSEIANRRTVNIATSLDYLPGVAVDHADSGRNEAAIWLRGFTSRGQVPLYIDSIPVSMPYDGTIDFNRFLAGDIAEVQVAKGFSSPLLGANAMGGSINLVTKQPEKKLDGDAVIGTGSGDQLLASMQLGSRWEHFYLQGSIDWFQPDFIPLSGDFPLNDFQPTYERKESYSKDAKYSGRFAWTPKGEDQYVFSYTNQKGKKGVPLYAGPNSDARFGRFAYRRWPYWNKTGYYINTNTGLGEASNLKLRGYYDQFKNAIDFFDDDTYTTQNNSTSNHSVYNDHSYGGSVEFNNRSISRNAISAAFTIRDDTHKEILTYPGVSPYPFITPTQSMRQQTFSIGFQDIITISSRLNAIVGFSADNLKGLWAQQRTDDEAGLLPITCPSDPDNTSFSGCMLNASTYNPQASLSFFATPLDTFYVTFADRGRFPLLKESYSYRLGSAIPNPELEPEKNRSWNIGWSHAFPAKTVAQVEYFHNHLRDAIESVYVLDPGDPGNPFCDNTGALEGYCSQNVNIANENHQGFEISIRSTPASRLTLDVSYSYINRNIDYDFGKSQDVSEILTEIQILPTLPKNKFIANATIRLPREILAIANVRYEGGITLQDTTYRSGHELEPFAESYATLDLGTVVPIYSGASVQAGVKNLFDKDYYYTAGYPQAGRNWFFNLRYRF
jgi:iron complex outermembrane receptor protein